MRRAEHRVVADEQRRADFGVAMLRCVQVEHELGESAFEARERALQHDEARARQFRRRLEIHQAERLADLEMLLRLKGEFLRRADFADLLVGLLVADRDVGQRRIGNAGEKVAKFGFELPLLLLALLDGLFEARHLVHQGFGGFLVLGGLGLADVLRGGVAAGLRILQLLNRSAAFLVQLQNSIQQGSLGPLDAAVLQPLHKGVLIVTNPFDVEHGLNFRANVRLRPRIGR